MELSRDERGDYCIIRMNGRMDMDGSAEVESYLDSYLDRDSHCTQLLLDFEGVAYISSGGLRVLVATLKRLERESGKLILFGMNIEVEQVFQFSGLDAAFKIAQDEEAAVQLVTSG